MLIVYREVRPGSLTSDAPTGPGAQNRYFSKGFFFFNDTFSVPAHWRISAPLPAPFRHPLLWRASAAPAGDSAWVCVPSATGRVPTQNQPTIIIIIIITNRTTIIIIIIIIIIIVIMVYLSVYVLVGPDPE